MHQEHPGAFLFLYKKDLNNKLEGLQEYMKKFQVHSLSLSLSLSLCVYIYIYIYIDIYIYSKDLIRKLEGMRQEDPSALYIYLYYGFNKEA